MQALSRFLGSGLFALGVLLLITCNDGSDTRSPLTLRDLADQRGMLIGTAVNKRAVLHDVQYMDVLAAEFNSITPEVQMKWKATEPLYKTYAWGSADNAVAFATAYGQMVRGHTLIWPSNLHIPDYVKSAPDAETMQRYIDDHIEAVVSRYADVVDRWDVVNEPLWSGGATLNQNVITATLGMDWMVRAFAQVRRLDPSARLYLNESHVERPGMKHQGLLTLVQQLIDAGAPIDGIGLQSHYYKGPPTTEEMVEVMRAWEAMGLEVAITELDISIWAAGDEIEQAHSYRQVFTACLSVAACREITLWGFTDKYSWLNRVQGPQPRPLLFDENYKPKPAYHAVFSVLSEDTY